MDQLNIILDFSDRLTKASQIVFLLKDEMLITLTLQYKPVAIFNMKMNADYLSIFHPSVGGS